MFTRQAVHHQYGHHQASYGPPPFHVYMHAHAYPQANDRAALFGSGGLMGGAVNLNNAAWVGSIRGNTGYGYLGMDPSDSSTWPRPFVPTRGMISYLNWQAMT
jgi:hypothetical protein